MLLYVPVLSPLDLDLKASKHGEGSTPTKYTHQKPGYIQEPFGKTTQNNSSRKRGRGVRKANSLRKRQSGVAAQVRGAMVRLPDNKKNTGQHSEIT